MRPRRVVVNGLNGSKGKAELRETAKTYNGRRYDRPLTNDDEVKFMEAVWALNHGGLRRLSKRQRECFKSVVVSGQSYRECAETYGISHRAVELYVQRAGLKLLKFIESARKNGLLLHE